ncbi:MAG: DUF5362 family protein [Arcicella sp.]|nr:DUF5362 family protein [Arcicella sp.]
MEDQLQLLQLTNVAKNRLISMSKWGKFISIGNIIMGVIIIIGSLFVGTFFDKIAATTGQKMPVNFLPIILVYSFIGVIIALPGFFLFSFSRKISKALFSENDALLEESLGSLNTYFTINGIIMILSLLFYALMIVVMVITISQFPTDKQ